MSPSEYIIDEQLLKNCIFAFNQIRNTKLKKKLTIYDLARMLEEVRSGSQKERIEQK